MQSVIRSCVLFLCVSLVKSKDCTLEEFLKGELYSSNFDTTDMEASYANNRQVRVHCNIGFSGSFRLECVNGVWKSKGTGCQRRSCGHPGDAAFADFELVNGTDFVFGSRVMYICQKGYHMVSRRNYRNCMAGGWDGTIPVCEAQQCPVIRVDNEVKVIGDLEEAVFGNVVLFSCTSHSQILKGPLELYCDENGHWTGWDGSSPKCEEITCSAPTIENGIVEGKIEGYRENELLVYRCNPKFKVASGVSSKCVKSGQKAEWSPTPMCKEIQCTLHLPALSGTSYEPANSNVFTPGQTVTVTCESTHWVESQDKTSTKATCKANGEWNVRPVCQEYFCPNGKDPLVDLWYVYSTDQKRVGSTAYYTCRTGSVTTHGGNYATCSREGWTPKPLCRSTQGTLCPPRNIDNAIITLNIKEGYSNGDVVEYKCRSTGRRFTISCLNGAWRGVETCPSDDSCVKGTFLHGFSVEPFQNTIFYACDDGYKRPTKGWWGTAKCLGGQWSELPSCIEKTKCGEPPVIPNGKATEIPQPDGEAQVLQITCEKEYVNDIFQLICQDGNWTSDPTSLETICQLTPSVCDPPPRVENAVVLEAYQTKFLSDSVIMYQCRDNFTMEGEDTIKCRAGEWEQKNTRCIQKPCPLPEVTPNGTYEIVFGKALVFGTMIKYTCNEGYQMIGTDNIRTCLEDGWTGRNPTCERSVCKEDVMHPKLRVTGLPTSGERMEYQHTLDFECNDDYHLDGASQIRCLQSGEWSAPFPTCSTKCKITEVPQNVRHQDVADNELLKGRNLTFTCQLRSHIIHGQASVQCLDNGQWSHPYPTCGPPMTCGNPPPLDHGDTKNTVKYTYNHNEKVQYRCQNFYVLEDNRSYRTCFNGEWRGDLKCLKPCTVKAGDMTTRNIRFRYVNKSKLYCSHNDEMEFVCTRGQLVPPIPLRVRCLDGEIHLPTCQ